MKHYITYGKQDYNTAKTIWGAGKSKKQSKKDAIKSITSFYTIEPELCILDYDGTFSGKTAKRITIMVRKELIRHENLKTIECTEELFNYIEKNGTQDFDTWKIKKKRAFLD